MDGEAPQEGYDVDRNRDLRSRQVPLDESSTSANSNVDGMS